jgi:hypothetical protein
MNKIYLILIAAVVLNGQVSVSVSKKNSLDTITTKELSNVYLKKTDKIKGDKVIVINNKQDYDEFNTKVLNKSPSQIHAYWMKQIFLGKNIPPKNISSKDIKKEINKDKRTIGYSSKELNEKVIYETK